MHDLERQKNVPSSNRKLLVNAADSELLAFAVVAALSPAALFRRACCLSCSDSFLALRTASMGSSSSENPVVLTADMVVGAEGTVEYDTAER